MWDKIPYLFSNFTCEKNENEWIISPHTTGHVITHQWRDWSDRYRDHWAPFIIKCGMKLLIHSQTSSVKNFKMNKWSHPTLRWAWAYFYMLGLKLIFVHKRSLRWNIHTQTYHSNNTLPSVGSCRVVTVTESTVRYCDEITASHWI